MQCPNCQCRLILNILSTPESEEKCSCIGGEQNGVGAFDIGNCPIHKSKEEKVEWCKHIIWQLGTEHWMLLDEYCYQPPYGIDATSWKRCPICGAKRPDAKKDDPMLPEKINSDPAEYRYLGTAINAIITYLQSREDSGNKPKGGKNV